VPNDDGVDDDNDDDDDDDCGVENMNVIYMNVVFQRVNGTSCCSDFFVKCDLHFEGRQSATERNGEMTVTEDGCELTDLKEHGRMGIK
jgi:hypothetical protein